MVLAPPALSLFIQYKKPDRKPLEPGQRVKVEGLTGDFIVVGIDKETKSAELMLADGTHHLTRNVPIVSILPIEPERQRAAG